MLPIDQLLSPPKDKIWLYLTVRAKEIHLTPPENIEMKCRSVDMATFKQILKDGFYFYRGTQYTTTPDQG